MITLLQPEALALAAPAAAAWWWFGRRGSGRWWRALTLAALVAAAARPEAVWGRGGSDVVLVLDRSASMGAARARQDELVRLAGAQRRGGDRLAVVAFGEEARVAQPPQAEGEPRLAEVDPGESASDLAGALARAAALVPPGRSARVVVHSDGEATGFPPTRAAARLAAIGARVDALPERRPDLPDAAVLDVELPRELRLGESFIGAARLIADRAQSRGWRVLRGDTAIASGTVALKPGTPTTIGFADRPPQPGVARYRVELTALDGDAARAQRRGAVIAELRDALKRPDARALLETTAKAAGMPPPDPATVDAAIGALEQPGAAQLLDHLLAGEDPGGLVSSTIAAAPPAQQPLLRAAVAAIPTLLAAPDIAARLRPADVDRVPANDVAEACLRVRGGERVLVVGGDGSPGNVARALSATGLAVTTRGEGALGLDDLLGCSALVLEQVPADKLGLPAMEAIARWVEHLGGGLVMTGGRRSFGAGGYHESPVERVLPVTMELRDEHRKLAVTMAIALDRSGSMSMPIGGGRTKMDLADEGAIAAMELLSARDQVCVMAVDTAPHVVVPMTRLVDKGPLIARVHGIKSEGGGIYVYEALVAAGKALLDAPPLGARHLVLFADASDAEEPGAWQPLVDDYVKAGITVSVVAMGTEKDSDAQMLKEIAARGRGRCTFAEDVRDLPRLFAQETVLVARSAWIGGAVKLAPQAALVAQLGGDAALSGAWPTIPGYNLTYARDRADVLALAPGDPQAPALATWRIGTGRAAALCCSADDPESGDLLGWRGYAPLIAGVTRWAAGGESHAPGALTATRAGRAVRLRLELDPAERARWPATAPSAVLDRDGADDAPTLALMPVDDGVYEGEFALDDQRVVLPAVAVDGAAVLGPALRLPYSPEAEPRYGRPPGESVLADLVRAGGGRVREDLVGVFDNPASAGDARELAPWLVGAALAMLVAEIAARRLRLGWPRRRVAARAEGAAPAANAPAAVIDAPRPTPAPLPTATAPAAAPERDRGLHEALRQLKQRRPRE